MHSKKKEMQLDERSQMFFEVLAQQDPMNWVVAPQLELRISWWE